MAALSSSIMDKISEVFNQLDVDKSGALDKSEVKTGLIKLGFAESSTTDDMVDSMVASVDTDGDGKVNIEEFAQLFKEGEKKDEKQSFGALMFNSLFSTLSFGGDSNNGNPGGRSRKFMTGSPTQLLFDMLDKNKDNTISAEEFVQLMVVAGISGGGSFHADERGARHVMQRFGFDQDEDGDLSEDEFSRLMERMGNEMGSDVSDLCTMFIEALNTTSDEEED